MMQRMMVIGLEMKETSTQYKLKPCEPQGLERDVVQDPWIVIESPLDFAARGSAGGHL